jgi:hypothetical protein
MDGCTLFRCLQRNMKKVQLNQTMGNLPNIGAGHASPISLSPGFEPQQRWLHLNRARGFSRRRAVPIKSLGCCHLSQ